MTLLVSTQQQMVQAQVQAQVQVQVQAGPSAGRAESNQCMLGLTSRIFNVRCNNWVNAM
jgi:hypothetical protein